MPRTGDRPAAARLLAWAGAVTLGTAALAGCTPGQEPSGGDASPTSGGPTSEGGIPQVDRDGYAPLTVYLVSPVWSAPPGTEGVRFGCQDQDLLVAVQTVPTKADDRLDMAVDFLLEDAKGSHGDPALDNALAASQKTLTYTGHHREGDTEVVEFSGTFSVQDTCAAERVRAQLVRTAEAATDASSVRVTVDGRDLDEVLQLYPLEFGDEYTAPPAEPETASPTDGGEATGAPAEPTAPAEPSSSWAPAEPSSSWAPASSWGPTAPAVPTVPGLPGTGGGEGGGRPSLPGATPSYGVETQPVLPPDAP